MDQKKPTAADPLREFERAVMSYLGGKLRDCKVPVSERLAPKESHAALIKHMASKGYDASFADREQHPGLMDMTLRAFTPPDPPASEPAKES